MPDGIEFQALGPVCEQAHSPNLAQRRGSSKRLLSVERKV
jgi:hypothetical protein